MMRLLRGVGVGVLLICVVCGVGYAQDSTAEEVEEGGVVPYEEDEFPQWLNSLRRFEIIALGSFPLTYFFTLLVYDLVRFTIESVEIGAVNPLYAPLFFAPPNKPPPTQIETIALVLSAVGVSFVVAIVDLIIQESKRKRVAERARIEEAIGRDGRISQSRE